MNKILRYSFIAILAFICNVSFAQTILWEEDFSSYEANAVPADGTYNYVCTASGTKIYNQDLAGGTAPELLVGKSTGSFSATIPLNGAKGTATLSFKSNKNYLKVEAKNATVGTVTAVGNDYSYPITINDDATEITITIKNSSSNARLDNIKLFQGESKKPAGLSWGTASRTVTIGSEDNKFPTLSNANKLEVTYSSSDPEVATIDAEGNITLVAAGKTNITASFKGDDTYEAGEVSYELTVKAASTVDITNTPETAYTVAQALELIKAGEGLDTKVYVKGTISKITNVVVEQYGNATYNISDDGTTSNELVVFRGYYLGGAKFTSEDQIKVGDVVIVYGKLVDYNGTAEVNSGSQIYSLNGETSNINGITTDDASLNAPVYNLAGQKVSTSYRGVVIKAGKKFIQK